MLSKAETVDQLLAVDAAIAKLEDERVMYIGAVELLPLIESVRGAESLSILAGVCAQVRQLSPSVLPTTASTLGCKTRPPRRSSTTSARVLPIHRVRQAFSRRSTALSNEPAAY